jgi:transcriptional regulator with XRE-family HTH domain
MEDVQHEQFGERILALRRERGWSPEKLAAEANVSLPTVRRVERGLYPRVEHLIALADSLDVTLDYLVGRGLRRDISE